ncbi:MAG: class I SAM-dependent methyltransferase [Burkholderiales bacterium]|nr:class I SAM-dependent methyltransferase [Burkholderiales bacterium]
MNRQGASDTAAGVATYFDGVADIWSRNYAAAGSMAERVDRFAVALAAGGVAAGARVLDFGCGSGDITRALAARGFAMTGADISPGMLAAARRTPAAAGVTWVPLIAADGAPLPFDPGAFDAVIASSVLEYVADPRVLIAALARLLRPGGLLAFTVPDMRDPGRQEEARWMARMDAPWRRIVLRLLPARLPLRIRLDYLRRSIHRIAPEEWRVLVDGCGLRASPVAPCSGPLLMMAASRPG